MGPVFHARDTKLDRDVTIKLLPEAFAHDADPLARFTREAKVLAWLSHLHIAAIHGLEESRRTGVPLTVEATNTAYRPEEGRRGRRDHHVDGGDDRAAAAMLWARHI
jgi:serine/threonine protein kinase